MHRAKAVKSKKTWQLRRASLFLGISVVPIGISFGLMAVLINNNRVLHALHNQKKAVSAGTSQTQQATKQPTKQPTKVPAPVSVTSPQKPSSPLAQANPPDSTGVLGATTNMPIPSSGVYWGIYTDPNAYFGDFSLAHREAVIGNAETNITRKYDYDRQFFEWGDDPFAASPTPNTYLKWSSSTAGHYMDINLVAANRSGGITTWAAIANGSQDAYIDTLAQDIKAWGQPAFFTFQHEPESLICPGDTLTGCDLSTYYGTTGDYKAAWQHLVGVFRANGVNNLSYVWQTGSYRWSYPNDYRYGPNNYPGSDVIDWIATDPFNSGSPWTDLSTLITPWYNWAVNQGKPLMIGAFGSQEDPNDPSDGLRAAWFAAGEAAIKARPQIKALMYYDNNPKITGKDNWLLFDGNQASEAAYKAWGLDSYFNTRNCNTTSCPGYTSSPSSSTPSSTPAPTATGSQKAGTTTTTPGSSTSGQTGSSKGQTGSSNTTATQASLAAAQAAKGNIKGTSFGMKVVIFAGLTIAAAIPLSMAAWEYLNFRGISFRALLKRWRGRILRLHSR